MPDYKKMYFTLFNTITDAIECLENANYGAAKDLLIEGQQKTEEIYIENDSSAEELSSM